MPGQTIRDDQPASDAMVSEQDRFAVANPASSLQHMSNSDSATVSGSPERTRAAFQNIFLDLSARQPNVEAILAPGRSPLHFANVPARLDAVRRALNNAGIGRGDIVAVVLPNGPEMAVCSLGIVCCAIAAPLSPDLSEDEFVRNLERIQPKAIVLPADSRGAARKAASSLKLPIIELSFDVAQPAGLFDLHAGLRGDPELPGWATANDIVLMLPTSGTTGRPKLVPLRQHHLLAYADETHRMLGTGKGDRCIHIVPMCHGHGFKASMLLPLLLGGGVVCTPKFDVSSFFKYVEAFQPTWYTAGHTVHRSILEQIDPYRAIARNARLRFIRSGSGRLDPKVILGLEEAFQAPVLERYGMSETGSLTYNRPVEGQRRHGTAGKCGRNEIRIVDDGGEVLGANCEGEILARGPTVFEGYWADPEANTAAFVDGWFRTGDLGVIDEDGFLTITGRLKEQINRGGQKVAPGEVEAVLIEYAGVAEACVFPVPHPTLGQEVMAAVVAKAHCDIDPRALVAFAREKLSMFKVPRKIVIVDHLPKSRTGKLQRNRMAETLGLGSAPTILPEAAKRESRAATPTEAALVGLWMSALRIEKVGIDDDFFLLGGDSLRAMRLLGQVQVVFGVDLRIAELFTGASTVSGMARSIDALRHLPQPDPATQSSPAAERNAVPRRDPSLPCPLSYQQQRLWFIDQLYPGNPVYHVSGATRMDGPLDVAALAKAINGVLARHDVLRTTFVVQNGEARQVVAPELEIELPRRDLSGLPYAQREAELRRLLHQEVRHPFDLSRGPLLRVLLVKVAEGQHVLLFVLHHIVTDVWSRRIFWRELAALYDAAKAGAASPLPPLPIQYADYATWQRRILDGQQLDRLLQYWRKRLEDAPEEVSLPIDRRRSAHQSFSGATLHRIVPSALFERFIAIARGERTTVYFTLLAAFAVLLKRYSGEEDIVVGVAASGRDRQETQGLIGFFLNMLPFRIDLSGAPSFRELIGRVREVAASDLAHSDLPFEKLVEELRPTRRAGATPFFRVSCVLHERDDYRVTRPGWRQDIADFDRGTAPFDLSFFAVQTDDGMQLSFRYDAGLFDEATIERMLSHFVRLVAAFADEPDRSIADVPLLSAAERDQIVVAWNRTEVDYPSEASLKSLFEARVDMAQNAIAVADENSRLSYVELDERANRLAHLLKEKGVLPRAIVGVCLDRSVDLIVAILAIIKTGGAYLPLDRNTPASRMAFVLDDTNTVLLLTRSEFLPFIDEAPVPTVCLDAVVKDLARCSGSRIATNTTGNDLAYVIYTSGTSAGPKGVAIPQTAVSRLVTNTNYVAFSPRMVMGAVSNVAFDAATFETWGALLNGGRIEILDDETVLRPDRLSDAIARRGINTMFLTTALFTQTANALPAALAGLEFLCTGGESLDPGVCARVLEAGAPEHFVHAYGPTETTTFATFFEIRSVSEDAISIPIGRPIANTRLYILGPDKSPVPVGVAGELYIGGPGVARGYVNRPELTEERFIPDPFSNNASDRLYRTGDRGRYRADGNIEFLGRLDRQLKLRGFRIEPVEIEGALLRHSKVAQAVILVQADGSANRDLYAYLAKRSEPTPSTAEMRAFLRSTLPDYMIPGVYVWLDKLPLTSNGKLDRMALPPVPRASGLVNTGVPRTPTERTVAEIWAEHLNLETPGVDDDFFALGGHSLLAAKIFGSLEQRFGIALPLALLFEAPTVAALAQTIDRRLNRIDATHVVAIQAHGEKNPIFALAGAGGSVVGYALLARGLGDDRPFYGLELPGLEDGEAPSERIEAIAARFAEDIRHMHCERPCILVGACSGALVAFELARVLASQGRVVEKVVMIDPARTGTWRGPKLARTRLWRRLSAVRFVFGRLTGYLTTYRRLDGGARREFLNEKASVLREIVRRRDLFRESRRELNQRRVHEAAVVALRAYVPQPYNGAVTLILGERFDRDASGKKSSTWKTVCRGPLQIVRIPGKTTGEMVREPIVGILIHHFGDLLQVSR